MPLFKIIIPCGMKIFFFSGLRTIDKTITVNSPEDVPSSVVWFKSIFETPFSRSEGQIRQKFFI